MSRIHLFEFLDQSWCPHGMRQMGTDLLQFTLTLGNHYAPMAPRLRRALERTGTRKIVDLGSGSGGPWLRLLPMFEERENFPVEVCLTDLYPNLEALARARAVSGNRISFVAEPVDGARLPGSLTGFRTLFSSFHHFQPESARAILEDAVRNRQGIGVFEFTERSPLAIGLMLLSPLALFVVPFIRPFRWSRLLWMWLVPVFGLWDGIVSCLRTYSPDELRELTEGIGARDYTWEMGLDRTGPSPAPITYLIGYPT